MKCYTGKTVFVSFCRLSEVLLWRNCRKWALVLLITSESVENLSVAMESKHCVRGNFRITAVCVFVSRKKLKFSAWTNGWSNFFVFFFCSVFLLINIINMSDPCWTLQKKSPTTITDNINHFNVCFPWIGYFLIVYVKKAFKYSWKNILKNNLHIFREICDSFAKN